MAKANKKSAKEASQTFHNIMAASVKGNPKPKEYKKPNNYSLPIEQMELPVKLQIVLKNNGVTMLKELASYDVEDLLQFKNLGIKSIALIERAIHKYGLRLGDFRR